MLFKARKRDEKTLNKKHIEPRDLLLYMKAHVADSHDWLSRSESITFLNASESSPQLRQPLGGKKENNIIMKKLLFDIWYRFTKPPWMIDQAQPDLIEAVEKGKIRGPTILDVGWGCGANAIYLASHGFEVTGVDFSA